VRLDCCALPNANVGVYETPLGNIELDQQILGELRSTSAFAEFSVRQDEEEHSIEMQLPFVKYMMGDQAFTLVPIVVGSTGANAEAKYGQLLAPYFELPDTLFIISSDFCHWGQRFGYKGLLKEPPVITAALPPVAYPQDRFPLNGSIEALDRAGMNLITAQDIRAFQRYLQEHDNTICGRHPICVFLEILQRCQVKCDVRFLHYSQSQMLPPNPSPSQSCVSYASGVCCTNCNVRF
jgi:AmmeMemoRadiSam system protein B